MKQDLKLCEKLFCLAVNPKSGGFLPIGEVNSPPELPQMVSLK